MVNIPIQGATPEYERAIRRCIATFPPWFVSAARVSKIIITSRPEIREQIAQYEHGSRHLYIYPGIGSMLLKAVGHELSHGVDDNFESSHFFTSSETWKHIHRNQGAFDIPKYELEPLEYFADMVTKLHLMGIDKMRTTNPDEMSYLTSYVFPTLKSAFGASQ
jgi:hypothetical protein